MVEGSLRQRDIGLSVIRVLYAIFILKNSIYIIPMANTLYGDNVSILSYQSYINTMDGFWFKFLSYPFDIPFAPELYMVIICATSILFLFCYRKTNMSGFRQIRMY